MSQKPHVLSINNPSEIFAYQDGLRQGKRESGLTAFTASAVYNAPAFSFELPSKEALLKHVGKTRERLNSELKHNREKYKDVEKDRRVLENKRDAYADMIKFCENTSPEMQRPEGSIFHKVIHAQSKNNIICPEDYKSHFGYTDDMWKRVSSETNVFLVEYDWNAAFRNADFDEGSFPLPYAITCFEFMISGIRACYVESHPDVGLDAGAFVKIGEYFIFAHLNQFQGSKALCMMAAQARAICISLDANVIKKEVIRAPEKLNEARAKRNEPPIRNYHVLSLSRTRISNPVTPTSEYPLHRKRLHWRRGHWRHFPTHKTWIKWMLCGNPDLGFVDKHYRLQSP